MGAYIYVMWYAWDEMEYDDLIHHWPITWHDTQVNGDLDLVAWSLAGDIIDEEGWR